MNAFKVGDVIWIKGIVLHPFAEHQDAIGGLVNSAWVKVPQPDGFRTCVLQIDQTDIFKIEREDELGA